ncbi:MAG: hypothetical protein SH847_14360 [Roseiflexaceae bacterium]|nr:hypothetical protein [Roseiflexaceae bacterium]
MTAVATSDIFISYADDAPAWVDGYLLDGLRQAGISCHMEGCLCVGRTACARIRTGGA